MGYDDILLVKMKGVLEINRIIDGQDPLVGLLHSNIKI